MLKIYGWSDDNVELEGDIREEFYVPDAVDGDENPLIVLSNGVVLRVKYGNDDDVWHFTPLKGSDKVFVIYDDQSDVEGSDVVMVDETINFAVCGTSLVENKSWKP